MAAASAACLTCPGRKRAVARTSAAKGAAAVPTQDDVLPKKHAAADAACLTCPGRKRAAARTSPARAAEAARAVPAQEDDLRPEQRAWLADFRALLGPGGAAADSQHLLRFLRARRWDLAAAKEQFEAAQRWRAESCADRLRRLAPGPVGAEAARAAASDPRLSIGGVECFPEARLVEPLSKESVWRRLSPVAWFGHDRKGRPIWMQRTGIASCHFPEMLQLFGADAIIDGFIRLQEVQAARMAESSALLGRPVTTHVVIMDLAGMAWKPHPRSLSLFIQQISIGARYYPETLGMHFFVNTPWVFWAVWRLLRPALDPVTASKMHILGSDYQEELLKHIEPGQLPKEFGGTNDFDALWAPLGSDELEELLGRHRAAYAAGVACADGVTRARDPKGAAGAEAPRRRGVAPPSSSCAAAPVAKLAHLVAIVLAAVACSCWLLAVLS